MKLFLWTFLQSLDILNGFLGSWFGSLKDLVSWFLSDLQVQVRRSSNIFSVRLKRSNLLQRAVDQDHFIISVLILKVKG